ncbi:MAG: hypothetical protein R3E86_05325 [Pseudomonadales bacterium]
MRTFFEATLLAGSMLAVAATAAAGTADIPRRPDGRPDLTGTYNVATLTPLQRPRELGDRLTLTDEEAKALAEKWQANLAKDATPSDPNREAPPEGGVDVYVPEFSGAAGKVGGYNAFFVDIGDNAFKLDGKWRTSIITQPENGRLPAISDAGKQRMAAHPTLRYRGHENTGTAWWIDLEVGPYDDPELRPVSERCLLGFGSTAGPPALPVMYNNLKRIVQSDDSVMILNEMNHDARIIRLNAEHPPAEIRKWMGDSVGHWEGDTLVVETTNFRSDDDLMASPERRVIERFSRIDGDTLRYQFTVEDPNTWVEPWSGEYPWPAAAGDERVYEYACHEGNHSFAGILRGARVLESDAEQAPAKGGSSGEE